MQFSNVLLLSFVPLLSARPTDSEASSKAKRAGEPGQYSYPAGYNADNCPVLPGNNPWDNYFAKNDNDKMKRDAFEERAASTDLTSTPQLSPRTDDNPACRQIAHNNQVAGFDPGNHNVGNTGQILLAAGAVYILSWGFSIAVRAIRSFNNQGDGHFNQFIPQHNTDGGDVGTFTFTVPRGQDVQAHFEFQFADEAQFPGDQLAWAWGEFAIFQIPYPGGN